MESREGWLSSSGTWHDPHWWFVRVCTLNGVGMSHCCVISHLRRSSELLLWIVRWFSASLSFQVFCMHHRKTPPPPSPEAVIVVYSHTLRTGPTFLPLLPRESQILTLSIHKIIWSSLFHMPGIWSQAFINSDTFYTEHSAGWLETSWFHVIKCF